MHHTRLYNRLQVIMDHTYKLSFDSGVRLAKAAGVSSSCIYHILKGRHSPNGYALLRITAALRREVGKPFPVEEVFSWDGTYPTPSVCALVDCPGCYYSTHAEPFEGTRR